MSSLFRSDRKTLDGVAHLPPLEATEIQNGGFRSGLTHWDTRNGQLLTSKSLSSPADGRWHLQEVDFFAPPRTDQLRIFVSMAGDSIVDVTGVTMTTSGEW